jgi:hypothetical protein
MHGTDHERALPDGKCPHYLQPHRRTDEPRGRQFDGRANVPKQDKSIQLVRSSWEKPR